MNCFPCIDKLGVAHVLMATRTFGDSKRLVYFKVSTLVSFSVLFQQIFVGLKADLHALRIAFVNGEDTVTETITVKFSFMNQHFTVLSSQ